MTVSTAFRDAEDGEHGGARDLPTEVLEDGIVGFVSWARERLEDAVRSVSDDVVAVAFVWY